MPDKADLWGCIHRYARAKTDIVVYDVLSAMRVETADYDGAVRSFNDEHAILAKSIDQIYTYLEELIKEKQNRWPT